MSAAHVTCAAAVVAASVKARDSRDAAHDARNVAISNAAKIAGHNPNQATPSSQAAYDALIKAADVARDAALGRLKPSSNRLTAKGRLNGH